MGPTDLPDLRTDDPHYPSNHAGSYILSNKPTFDPSSVIQDQRWTEMKREKQ